MIYKIQKYFSGVCSMPILLANAWMFAFTLNLPGECGLTVELASVGQGRMWRQHLEGTYLTNGVPFLWHAIYWKNEVSADSEEWNRKVYCHASFPKVVFHAVSPHTNTVGTISAIELFYPTNMIVRHQGGEIHIAATQELAANSRRWNGVLWQYVERAPTLDGVRVFDFYGDGLHQSTVVSITNILHKTRFMTKKRQDVGKGRVLDLSWIRYFESLPLVDVDEMADAFVEAECQLVKLSRPALSDDVLRKRARAKITLLKSINGRFECATDEFKKLIDPSFVEWKDASGPVGARKGIYFSADGRMRFITWFNFWSAWPGLPTMSLGEVIVDVESFSGMTDVILPCGHRIPTVWGEKKVSCKAEQLAKTVDGRRRLVGFCSCCVALYETGKLKAILCREKIREKEAALAQIMRAQGEWPLTCISHEYEH